MLLAPRWRWHARAVRTGGAVGSARRRSERGTLLRAQALNTLVPVVAHAELGELIHTIFQQREPLLRIADPRAPVAQVLLTLRSPMIL